MSTFEPTCTEPGRWTAEPNLEASADEILDYLRHCDICEYHALLKLEHDLSLDLLLREACRDLSVEEVSLLRKQASDRRSVPRLFSRRARGRRPLTHRLAERSFAERRLAQACMVAFGIVVLWISYTAYQLDQHHLAAASVSQADSLAQPNTPLASQALDVVDTGNGRLYVSRTVPSATEDPLLPSTASTDEEPLTVAIPFYATGSILRVTNPVNGASVVVKVIQRTQAEREIVLSTRAAEALDVASTAIVFVEVLSVPQGLDLAP